MDYPFMLAIGISFELGMLAMILLLKWAEWYSSRKFLRTWAEQEHRNKKAREWSDKFMAETKARKVEEVNE